VFGVRGVFICEREEEEEEKEREREKDVGK
jgi:hypothetical protein